MTPGPRRFRILPCRWFGAVLLGACLAGGDPTTGQAQQLPDSTFIPAVSRPQWELGGGPVLCLDEGHHNFHTLANRFLAFGRLAARDGFVVRPLRARFSAAVLSSCRLLVIANAQPNDEPWERYPVPTPSAFTADEITAIREWIAGGRSLLLLADHQPLAGAAASLAAALGFRFTDGFALPRFASAAARDASVPGGTLFRQEDGTLVHHPVVSGRTDQERVTRVRSFTGQAFHALDSGSTTIQAVMRLPDDYVLLQPRIAWQFTDSTPQRPVGGWLQGATNRIGRGRVAVFGEAAMFSAQVQGAARRPMGMNAPMAEQNAQFVLNVLHWLLGVLDP